MVNFIRRTLFVLFVIATLLVVLALTDGGDGFRWFGKTVRDVSFDIAETLDHLHQATEDIKSASHTIKKTGTRIKDIAEETSDKASNIVDSTGEIMKDIKFAVTDSEPEEKEASEESLGMSESDWENESGVKNTIPDIGEKVIMGKKLKRRAVKKKRTAEQYDTDMEPQ